MEAPLLTHRAPRPARGYGFAGWGRSDVAFVSRGARGELVVSAATGGDVGGDEGGGEPSAPPAPPHAALGALASTSIAGNDLLSSCLYTGGICAAYAGKMAPLSLLLVSVMLYFFRFVYAEVVTAMPMNGGSYTALNNTTSKRIAAMAACLSIISYVATAVVSAESAVQYLQLLAPAINTQAGTLVGTVVLLGVFALLNLLGMSESAAVAMGMFVLHVATLSVLSAWCLVWAARNNWGVLRDNLNTPYPSDYSPGMAIYLGYAAALLGITGFETAANYVEDMKDSATYVATLRNMWISVSIFNPLLGFLAMSVMPLSCAQVPGCDPSQPIGNQQGDFIYKYQANLLGPVASVVGGPAFKAVVCVDGVIVLAGSVLTAYVGIVGLVRRMALDRCLPGFLLQLNALRSTPHWIILGFFGVASSLLLLLNGDVDMLSSVYNLAFLSVMTAFAISCVVLKWKRPDLPRLVIASPFTVAAALVCVVAGLVGNVLRAPFVLVWFFVYFGVAAGVVFAMFNRTLLLRVALVVARVACVTRREAEAAKERAEFLMERYDEHERARVVPAVTLVGATSSAASAAPSPRSPSKPAPSLQGGSGGDAEGGPAAAAAAAEGGSACEERGLRLPRAAREVGPFARWGGGGDGHDDGAGDGGDGESARGERGYRGALIRFLLRSLDAINGTPYVFFAKDPDMEVLNKAILYVRSNEQTKRLVVVHVVDDVDAMDALQAAAAGAGRVLSADALERDLPPLPAAARRLVANVALLDAAYPKLRVDSLLVRGTAFGPLAVRWVAARLGVGPNLMFMAMPDAFFPHRFAALGGLRVITRAADAATREARGAHLERLLKHGAATLDGGGGGGGSGGDDARKELSRGLLPAA